MREDGDRRSVLAFHLKIGLALPGNDSHYGRTIRISLLPFEAMVGELEGRRIFQWDFSGQCVCLSSLSPSIHAVEMTQARRLRWKGNFGPTQYDSVGSNLGLKIFGRRKRRSSRNLYLIGKSTAALAFIQYFHRVGDLIAGVTL